jgi:hypothetical protein
MLEQDDESEEHSEIYEEDPAMLESERESSPSPQPSTSQMNEKPTSESLIPDDYDKLLSMLRRANLIKDSSRGTAYRNSFKGEEFVNWIMVSKQISKFTRINMKIHFVERNQALELGQTLIDKHFGAQLDKDHSAKLVFSPDRYYLMQDEDPYAPLNVATMPNLAEIKVDIPVGEMNSRLCEVVQQIYDEILSADRRVCFP